MTKYGGYNLRTTGDVVDAIKNKHNDKEVFINPSYIESITIHTQEIVDQYIIDETYNRQVKDRSREEQYFNINMHRGNSYSVRACYWDKFYAELTK